MNRTVPYAKPNPQIAMLPYNASTIAAPKLYEVPGLEALQSRTLYFGRLPADITDDKLQKLCDEYGDIKKCVTYPQKFMGFVEFYDIRAADKCRCGLKGHKIGDKTIEVQYSTPKIKEKDNNTGTLYVRPQAADKNFIDPNSLDDYKTLFERYGEGDVKKVSANRKRAAEKFVEFFDCRNASKAQEALNGYSFNGIVIEVQFAQQPSRSINKDSKAAEFRRDRRGTLDGYAPFRGYAGGFNNSDVPTTTAPGSWGVSTSGYNTYSGYTNWGMYGGRGWGGVGNGEASTGGGGMGYGGGGGNDFSGGPPGYGGMSGYGSGGMDSGVGGGAMYGSGSGVRNMGGGGGGGYVNPGGGGGEYENTGGGGGAGAGGTGYGGNIPGMGYGNPVVGYGGGPGPVIGGGCYGGGGGGGDYVAEGGSGVDYMAGVGSTGYGKGGVPAPGGVGAGAGGGMSGGVGNTGVVGSGGPNVGGPGVGGYAPLPHCMGGYGGNGLDMGGGAYLEGGYGATTVGRSGGSDPNGVPNRGGGAAVGDIRFAQGAFANGAYVDVAGLNNCSPFGAHMPARYSPPTGADPLTGSGSPLLANTTANLFATPSWTGIV